MKIQLHITGGKSGDFVISMDRSPYVIGRTSDCDAILDSRTVSRRHCEFKWKSAGLTVKDLGSRNGTLLNGQVLPPEKRFLISSGDVIQVGRFLIEASVVEGETKDASQRVDQSVEESNSPTESAPHEALLAMLDSLAFDSVDRSAKQPSIPRVPVEPESGSPITADGKDDDEKPVTETGFGPSVYESTVISEPESSEELDPAEQRRLELRKRIEAMKAKDSKEAADRALKNLFGGKYT